MIYCVEDDASIRELMEYALRASGFSVMGIPDAAALWQRLGEQVPELILLDIMLPDEDGISILKKLRASPATAQIPVIMATAKGTEFDKVIGLDLGADDYLAKPFGMMEMVSRVKAVLRRSKPAAPAPVLRYQSIELNEASHRVSVAGQKVELTVKEYELLRLLMTNQNVVLSREVIMRHVWGTEFEGESRTVDMHIKTLRQKLGEDGSKIRTVRNVGYVIEKA